MHQITLPNCIVFILFILHLAQKFNLFEEALKRKFCGHISVTLNSFMRKASLDGRDPSNLNGKKNIKQNQFGIEEKIEFYTTTKIVHKTQKINKNAHKNQLFRKCCRTFWPT